MRLPFEVVNYYADFLLKKSAFAKSNEESLFYKDAYVAYINSCGWSDIEFNRELLNRIDNDWDLDKSHAN